MSEQVGAAESTPFVQVTWASPDIAKSLLQVTVYCAPSAIVAESGWIEPFETVGFVQVAPENTRLFKYFSSFPGNKCFNIKLLSVQEITHAMFLKLFLFIINS